MALNIPPPWGKLDLKSVAAIPRFWYQWLLASPLGYWVLRNRPGFVRSVIRRGDRETWTDDELAEFTEVLQEPARARATQQIYRTFTLREFPKIARGRYDSYRLTTPTRLLFGEDDFAISKTFLRGYEPYVDDFEIEFVPDTGHFIAEQRPQLVTDRILEFFSAPVGASASRPRSQRPVEGVHVGAVLSGPAVDKSRRPLLAA